MVQDRSEISPMGSRVERQKAKTRLYRRSRSPPSHDHGRRDHKRYSTLHTSLPFSTSALSKHDYSTYKPVFGRYLDIQKQLILEELSDTEARGRWKSFVGKWNRGELAEGWYDPSMIQKTLDTETTFSPSTNNPQGDHVLPVIDTAVGDGNPAVGSSEEDEAIGPALPKNHTLGRAIAQSSRLGPAIPNLQDLELRNELITEDTLSARDVLRHERALNRKHEKERLEELTPRADAGTKERMLEKKREKADGNRAFASSKAEAGGVVDVPESDLLGDDGGIEGFKKQKKEMERKKNEREIRREEVLRARAVEREERVKQYREKEEATMKGLVELARARFG